jgi:spermidine/putrescine transport system permease protein
MNNSKLHRLRSNTLPVIVMVGPVTLILALLVALPLVYVLVMSFCSIDDNYNVVYSLTLKNYERLLNKDYLRIYSESILIAALTTVIALLVSYPFAYVISRTKSRAKNLLYMLVIIPFWTNSLIRIYGWRTFLGTSGWLNEALTGLGLASEPMDFLFKRGTTVLGMVYSLIPFMILPLYTAIEKLDGSLIEASQDLGARKLTTIFRIVIPLTSSGIFSGCLMIFIPCLGYFFVSDILGGGNSDVIGNLIERQFQSGNNWPLGSALSIVLILITLVLVKLFQKTGGNVDDLAL